MGKTYANVVREMINDSKISHANCLWEVVLRANDEYRDAFELSDSDVEYLESRQDNHFLTLTIDDKMFEVSAEWINGEAHDGEPRVLVMVKCIDSPRVNTIKGTGTGQIFAISDYWHGRVVEHLRKHDLEKA